MPYATTPDGVAPAEPVDAVYRDLLARLMIMSEPEARGPEDYERTWRSALH